jgi:UDP-N-acetylglucosamine 2-epimerase (non-hydrolysing)
VQEETTVLGVPCLTVRENTERPITIDVGTNQLVGTRPEAVLRAASSVLEGSGRKGRIPPLWDGSAGERAVAILAGFLGGGEEAALSSAHEVGALVGAAALEHRHAGD